ncbi:MAG: hypothetical protein R6X22_04435 [Gemmatimonadota bacterium]|jgi:hypothetical protein
MDPSQESELKREACEKANKLKKMSAADFGSFGEWVTAVVLDTFANSGPSVTGPDDAGKYKVSVEFEVSRSSGGEPTPCAEAYSLMSYAAADCVEVTIRGRTVLVC